MIQFFLGCKRRYLSVHSIDFRIKSCCLISKLCFGCQRRDLSVNVIYPRIQSCRLCIQCCLCREVGGVNADGRSIDDDSLSGRQLILFFRFEIGDLLDHRPIVISFLQTYSYHTYHSIEYIEEVILEFVNEFNVNISVAVDGPAQLVGQVAIVICGRCDLLTI